MFVKTDHPLGFTLRVLVFVALGMLDRWLPPVMLGASVPLMLASSFGVALVFSNTPHAMRTVWVGSILLALGLQYRGDNNVLVLIVATLTFAMAMALQCLIAANYPRKYFKSAYHALNRLQPIVVLLGVALPVSCLLPSAVYELFLASDRLSYQRLDTIENIHWHAFLHTWLGICFSVTLFAPLMISIMLRQRPLWEGRWRWLTGALAIVLLLSSLTSAPAHPLMVGVLGLLLLLGLQPASLHYSGKRAKASLSILNVFHRMDPDEAIVADVRSTLDRLQTIAQALIWEFRISTDTVVLEGNWKNSVDLSSSMTKDDYLSQVHPDDMHAVSSVLDALIARDITERSLTYRLLINDQYEWVMHRVQYIESRKAGKLGRLLGVVINVNEQATINEQLNLFRRVMDSSNDMIMICIEDKDDNHQLKAIYVNYAFVTRSGYLRSDVLGKSPQLLFGKQTSRRAINSIKRAIFAKSAFRTELATYTKSGGANWDEITIQPVLLSNSSPINWIFVLRDASKRKDLEDGLKKAVQAANENTRAKSNFISTMSHEIRTPMHGIIGLIELAMLEELPASARSLLGTAQTASQTLLTILNDILLFSKIEEDKVTEDVSRISLDKLLVEIRNLFFASASLKGIGLDLQLSKDCPQWVVGDATKIRQVLSNLVGNAIKFTSRGAVHIILDLVSSNEKQVTVRFSVLDTGIGLDPAALEYVLQPFHQASTDTWNKYGGSGLGLTICQRLLNLMHSELKLIKATHGGAHFYFDLTLGISAARDQTSSKDNEVPEPDRRIAGLLLDPAQLPLRALSILLAEDNPINQEIAAKFLTRAGAKVEVAENGVEVLRMIAQKNYDIILMDLQMPQMDGLTATQELFKHPSWNHCPIIGVSAGLSNQDKDKCLAAGMQDFLLKPVNWQQLIALLRDVVKPIAPSHDAASANMSKETPVPRPPAKDEAFLSIEETVQGLNDTQLALRLLGMFSADSLKTKSELNNFLSQHNLADAKKKLHYLKGSASILGMHQLLETINAFNAKLTEGELDRAAHLAFIEQLDASIAMVNSIRADLETKDKLG